MNPSHDVETSDKQCRTNSRGAAPIGPRLSDRVYQLLVKGDTGGRYSSPMAVACAIIAEAAHAGHDIEHLRKLLANESNVGGDWYRRRVDKEGQRSADRQLQYFFDKSLSQQRPQLADATEARITVHCIQQRAAQYQWFGRAGATRFKVFLAHTQVAMGVGSLTYTASTRQIAERAKVFRTVVQKRNAELCQAKLLARTRCASGAKPDQWTICQSAWAEDDPIEHTLWQSIIGSCLHDAFRYGTGLDTRVWTALNERGHTPQELADQLGMKTATVRRKLRMLKADGLAEQQDTGEWVQRCPPGHLDHIASTTGMAERSSRQQLRHQQERDSHHIGIQRYKDGVRR